MLWALLDKSGKQHFIKQQLYGHLPPIQIKRRRHRAHCWRSKVLQWTPSNRRASVERPARTNLQQLSTDIGCSQEDLPEAMDDRDGCRETVRKIPAHTSTWWWWWWYEFDVFTFFAVTLGNYLSHHIDSTLFYRCYLKIILKRGSKT